MEDFEDIVNNYIKTLIRKNILNIENNLFLKKPYIEDFIIKLSYILDKELLLRNITSLLDNDKITNEELFLIIKNNIELTSDEKKNISGKDGNFGVNGSDLVMYQIKYFRTYQIITELLFESTSNELYYFIMIYIKNKKSEMTIYKKKNFKFKIFNYYMDELFSAYENIVKLMITNNLLKNKEISNKDIKNMFLKKIFSNWYIIYKKDILDCNVNNKVKDYVITNTSLLSNLSKIMCLKNI